MKEIKTISVEELEEIIEIIYREYGYDFTNYARSSFKRRILRFMDIVQINTAYDFKFNLLNNPDFFKWLLQVITVNVTEMFRDPVFYKALRDTVLPRLATYPIIKIWHAGCASGEEVYSMNILLYELGLLERSRVYATDMNAANIAKARSGIISLQDMKSYTRNYFESGGEQDFSSYYKVVNDQVMIEKKLRSKVVFSQHNLVTDKAFNEFHLICCRNVLIYFNRKLQQQVAELFYQSLAPLGYLALGMKESLWFAQARNQFETFNPVMKIYRRKG